MTTLSSSYKRPILTLAIAAAILFLSMTAWFVYFLLVPASKGASDQVFIVSDGSTLSRISAELEKNGLIRCKDVFLIYARLKGYGRNIKAGEYLLNPKMSSVDIMDILRRGVIITHSVTIPEGYNRRQIARLLARTGLVKEDDFLAFTADAEAARGYGLDSPNLEGYLYPDTYHFSRGLSAKAVSDVMVARFFEIISPYRERIEKSGMSLEQVVTLASIIEKETGRAEERPVIASVFLNRLKSGVRLESDPTVIYGIEDFDGNLKKKDLARKNPYNTYVIRGLPPGAIASPGEDAIRAVLFPADTQYFYFVSKNNGGHQFSRTLSDHNRAVRIFQKSRHKPQSQVGQATPENVEY